MGVAQEPYSKYGLAGAQPRVPGSGSQGGALEDEFLTGLPSDLIHTEVQEPLVFTFLTKQQVEESESRSPLQVGGQTKQGSPSCLQVQAPCTLLAPTPCPGQHSPELILLKDVALCHFNFQNLS